MPSAARPAVSRRASVVFPAPGRPTNSRTCGWRLMRPDPSPSEALPDGSLDREEDAVERLRGIDLDDPRLRGELERPERLAPPHVRLQRPLGLPRPRDLRRRGQAYDQVGRNGGRGEVDGLLALRDRAQDPGSVPGLPAQAGPIVASFELGLRVAIAEDDHPAIPRASCPDQPDTLFSRDRGVSEDVPPPPEEGATQGAERGPRAQ